MDPRQYCQEFQDARLLDFRVLGCQSTGMSVLGPGTSWTWIIRVLKCHLSEYRMWEYWDVRVLRFQCVGMWEYWDVKELGCLSAGMSKYSDIGVLCSSQVSSAEIYTRLPFILWNGFSLPGHCGCVLETFLFWKWYHYNCCCYCKKKRHKFLAIFVDKAWFCFISIMAMVLVLISNDRAF